MIGKTIGPYRVERKLGQGGMGVVYQALDTRLERPVALKVLPAELTRDAQRRARFIQEAKAASAVNHPAIAQIYDVESEGDLCYIAMEYVDGSTVSQLLARNELDVLSAAEIGAQVASALAAAHDVGIVHRDIKSDNIMVTKDGHPKVLDFGLAKLLDRGTDASAGTTTIAGAGAGGAEPDGATMAMSLTQAGMVMGTVAYMSPEQARGLPADRRSDIFSFGIVLYEMATGELPFKGQSALDTMHAIAFEDTRPVTSIRAGLPYTLQNVIDRCLEKEPDARYASMNRVVDDLTEVKRELESGVTRSAPFLDRFRSLAMPRELRRLGLTARGILVVGIWAVILGALGLTALIDSANPVSLLPFLVVFAIVIARVRGQRSRTARKVVKKARKQKPVRLVAFDGKSFTVLLDPGAPARTYVKLNALLESANHALYQNPPFEMDLREVGSDTEVKDLLLSAGVMYVRED